jgi:hypothetical protein
MTKPSDSNSFTAEQAAGCARDSDTILWELTKLARVQTSLKTNFRNAIERMIKEARKIAKQNKLSSTQISAQLCKIENDVEKLRARLVAADHRVLNFIDAALWEKKSRIESIERYISHLETLRTIIKSAKEDAHRTLAKKGRPTGLQSRFDVFAYQLVKKAHSCDGKLTIYKTEHAEGDWGGSLFKAIRLLEPLLPRDFFPTGNLGQRLYRVAKMARL